MGAGLKVQYMKNALITGSTGFVGYHLVRKLLDNDYKVKCLVRETSDTFRLNKLGSYGKIEVIKVSSLTEGINNQKIGGALEDVDEVFHLAAATHGTDKEIYDSNVRLTGNLIDICHNSNLKRFIFISSIAARGASSTDHLISEETPYRPLSPYGKSKMEAELILRKSELPFTICSPAVVVGEGDREMMPVYRMIKNKNISFKVGLGNQRLSFIYVEDLAEAIMTAADSDKALGKSYILSDGFQYTQTEYLRKIGRSLGKKNTKVIPLPAALAYSIAGAYELWSKISGSSSMLSVSKVDEMRESWVCQPSQRFIDDTGWKPKVSLDEAIQRTANWLT